MRNLTTDLIDRLTEVQNRIAADYNVPIDIMSFCLGMMDQAAAEVHVARYEKQYPPRA